MDSCGLANKIQRATDHSQNGTRAISFYIKPIPGYGLPGFNHKRNAGPHPLLIQIKPGNIYIKNHKKIGRAHV